jgi:aspartate/methionine/tyrosine aminotransferase
MELLDQAKLMMSRGEDVIRLEAGEPDWPSPPNVIEAGREALANGETGYTPSAGRPELREAISEWYRARYGVAVDPDRIFVTSGSSPALLLALAAVVDRRDGVLVSDPGYPGYANAARFLEAQCTRFPVLESEAFAYSADRISEAMTPHTKAIMVNSPANPTGACVAPGELERICSLGPWVISDEIYHELSYDDERCRTALECTDRCFVVNGFSKRYAMPGWRLGWVVVPETCLAAVRNMNQNFLLAAGTVSQAAGIVALRHTEDDVRRMRDEYRGRRDLLVHRLREIGFGVPAPPDGALYVFANATRFSPDSIALAKELLSKTGVSVTPGIDFGPGGEGYIRLSYTTTRERIAEAMDRMQEYLAQAAEPRASTPQQA